MRIAWTVAALSLLVLAAGGLAYWRGLAAALPDANAVLQARALEERFAEGHAPLARLDLAALLGEAGTVELLDPAAALPQTHRHVLDDLRALRRHERDCVAPAAAPPALAKAHAWAEQVCGRASVPDGFFAAPPYLHPGGRSFVRLAADLGRAPFTEPAFWPRHRRWAHVSEWPGGDLTEPERALAGLGPAGLRALLRREPLLVARAHLLRLERGGARDAGAAYAVYDRAAWERHLDGAPLRLIATGDAPCLAGAGAWCWTANRAGAARAGWLGAVALGALAALATALLGIAVGRRRAARRELEDRLFLLRTLAHELRTPATAIALDVEALRADLDTLPEADRDAVLRLVDQVQRLRRVLEVTSRFLRLHRGEEPLDLVTVPSVNDLVRQAADDHGDVGLVVLERDAGLRTDPRWLRVCLDNLLANARAHGTPPFGITLRHDGRHLSIEVSDGGDTSALGLRDMTAAFYRGPASAGLGLGLSIVQHVVRALGGQLSHRPRPTTFVMRLPA